MGSVDRTGTPGGALEGAAEELGASWRPASRCGGAPTEPCGRWALARDIAAKFGAGGRGQEGGGKGSGAACGQRPMNAQYTSEILDRVAFGGGCLWTCDTVGNRAYHRDSDHGEHAMSPRIVNIYVCIKSKQ